MKTWKIALILLALATPAFARPYFEGEANISAIQHTIWLRCTPKNDTILITVTLGELATSGSGEDVPNDIDIAQLMVQHIFRRNLWNRAEQYDLDQKITTLQKNRTYEWSGINKDGRQMIGILSLQKGELFYANPKNYKLQTWTYTENIIEPGTWKSSPAVNATCLVTQIQPYEEERQKVSQK